MNIVSCLISISYLDTFKLEDQCLIQRFKPKKDIKKPTNILPTLFFFCRSQGLRANFCLEYFYSNKYLETIVQNVVFFQIAKNLLGILRNFCLKYSNFLSGISSKLLLGIARKFLFVISFNILFPKTFDWDITKLLFEILQHFCFRYFVKLLFGISRKFSLKYCNTFVLNISQNYCLGYY